jgi:hypothetical protein
LAFEYDAAGNRVTKIVKPDLSHPEGWSHTYYVRDASGNVMATYLYKPATGGSSEEISLKEHHVYGSSRIAVVNENLAITTASIADHVAYPNTFGFNKGKRSFELTNHLGNVMSVVTDKKIPDFTSGNLLFDADIISYSDYYPGGSLMPGRNGNSNEYRYGFNQGSEKDDEITGVTGSHYSTHFRELDTRILRWWGVDPKTNLTPWESPYSSMGNNPIWYNDPLGDIWDKKKDKKQADKMDVSASNRMKTNNAEISKLQKGKGNEDAIKDLQGQNTELKNSIAERQKMGSTNDPTRYSFEKVSDLTKVGTSKSTNSSGENVMTMKYGDEAEAFHEQVHGYKRGQELLNPNVTYGSGYGAPEEAAAKRREYSALPTTMRNTRGPLFQKGMLHITTANWVERVRQASSNPRMPKEYIKISNDWLKDQGKPPIK